MTLRGIAAAALTLLTGLLGAQVERAIPRDLIEQRIETAAELLGEDSNVDLTNLFEVLVDYYRDPLNLNRCTPADLEAMALLNDVQLAAFFAHRNRLGPLLSVYELQTIDAWDPATLELIRPFVTVKESGTNIRTPFKDMFGRSEHVLYIRSVTDVQQRRGYMGRNNIFGNTYSYPNGNPLPDLGDPAVVDSLRANSKVYLGSPYQVFTRYRMRYRNNLSFGITAEKDAGEEFFRGTQTQGFDFYSAHLFLREVGPFKSVVIGDYQAQFGQGLTCWTGLAFASKSSFSLNVKRSGIGLSPYTSVNENRFLRGVGATVGLGRRFDLTGFYSRNKLDATLSEVFNEDTSATPGNVNEAVITSFQEGGFHRTTQEMDRKHRVTEQLMGAHLRYAHNFFQVGMTAVHSAFSNTLNRSLQTYNQFEFNGRSLTNVGMDWNMIYRNLTWFGEVSASSSDGNYSEVSAVGYLTGLLAALDRRVSLALLFRNYPRDLRNLHAVAFREGTLSANERGLYTGIEIRPNREWGFNAYFDQYRFPWLRYQVNAPSAGHEVLAQLNWRPARTTEIYLRYRDQRFQRNSQMSTDGMQPAVDTRLSNYRFNASYRVSPSVSLRNRVDVVEYQRTGSPMQHGFLIYQDIVHRPLRSTAEFTFRLALFETTSYDARVYAFESDLIGLFSIPPYSGRGMRWYAMVRLTPQRRVDLWVRYGSWIFNDQNVISSGLQEINGNVRSDVKVQLRIRL
ncbi:MAG: helix-hairpin-helix domain-containing protein [Flavobacteriales bacterium]|nr:helix-hairpin-helix domain-containing protein [Flavobacteriales bacterium]